MIYSDETLMAYVDRELDPATAAAIGDACARDRELAARVERQRRLRSAVGSAYAPVLEEPPPDRLLAMLQTEPASATKVVDLADVRANWIQRKPRWSWREWGALAASVVLGALIGGVAFRAPEAPLLADDGQLVARGALAQALSQQLAAEAPDGAPVRIGLSYVSKKGAYCRTFVLRQQGALAGLACRVGEQWHVQIATQDADAAAGASDYRMAGADVPAAVLRAVDESIAGSALDAQGERAARARGWQR